MGKEKVRINHNDYDLRIEIDYKICAVVWSIWTSTCLHINKMEARSLVFNRVSKELVGIALIAMFLFLLFFVDFTSLANLHKNMPQEWLNVNTLFLSIIFEAIPFYFIRGNCFFMYSSVCDGRYDSKKSCRNLQLLQ
ncbi:hypothetical protein ACT7DM_12660 [Bacillus cereus]